MVCIRCQKRPAIIFVQRMENGQMKNEGYCLHCAREMHIKPVDDLMKQFESALCEFWSAKHSQIYPELKKLTEEGCVAYRQEASDNGLEKKLYHITEKGRTDFMSWLSSETPAQPTPKDISRLKIFFCSCLPKEERKFMLEEQVYRHTARLKHLQNNQQKFSQVPDSDSNEFGDYLVLMGAIMREEMMIEWLKKSISLLN